MNIQDLVLKAKQQLNNVNINKKNSIAATALASALVIGSTGSALAFDGDHNGNHDREDDKTVVKSSIQYAGPVETVTIKELLAQDSWFKDQKFTLEGNIVKQVNDSQFIFTDGNDEMTIKIKSNTAANFSDKDKVRISGEYDSEMFSTSYFKVKKLTVL
ncbi:NirD/YgiW/YdeI family stress tolerance protein [Photobacterium sagamiensis]|uniref:YgiW/YdeI family stress tolerance OB fold protein n=1 Tax=Photobacterium sagamiensis TaxID=2910241 RepID=UPI003D11BC29